MLFLGFVFLLFDLQKIYGLNGYIFDGELTPIIIEYDIKRKRVDTIKQDIKQILKENNINGNGFSFWYLNYNGVNNQFIEIENPIPVNDHVAEIVFIVYQNMDMILFRQALLALNSVGSFAKKKGVYYFGETSKNGYNIIPHGIGTLKYGTGARYTGKYVNGIRQGYGVYKWIDGSSYKGMWNNDQANGYGEFITKDGYIYNGDWKESVKDGDGIMKYGNGDMYAGEWKNDKREGFGRFKRIENDQDWPAYIGHWKHDCFHGLGIMHREDGKYFGNYFNDKRYGNGVRVYNNGNKYVGEWKNGKKHGYGTYIYADGRQYIGRFQNDEPNGNGRWYNSNNTYDILNK